MLGVRPVDVGLSWSPSAEAIGTGTVSLVENLGDEQIVAVRVGDQFVESVIDTSVSAKVGDQVWLLVQPERVHVFDLGTGRSSRRDAAVVGGDRGAGMATVTLRGLSKRFGRTRAVENLDLTVDDGEFFVLLGPSGAGKTTTLGLIAGLETPDSGEIFLGDDEVTRVNPWKRDVAMAFESYALYPHMSVFDNIAFPLRAPTRYPRLSEQAIKTEVTASPRCCRSKVAGPVPITAQRRSTATHVAGTHARAPAARFPDGRADRPPRRQAPAPHAGRAETAPRAVCGDHPLRDA